MKRQRTWYRTLIATIAAVGVAYLILEGLSYHLASSAYRGLAADRPLDQSELEARLGLLAWRARSFDRSTSWARNRPLEPGEHLVRYLVLGREPIDVILADDGSVVGIYSSFE
jgi:hypothetical protein